MPKLPRMGGAECVRILQRLGFTIVGHMLLRRGERGCVVPLHHERKTGTLHGILKQAGVDADDFLKAG